MKPDERIKPKDIARSVVATHDVIPADGAAIAYQRIMAVALARLEGKHFAPRRPPCSVKVTLGDGLIEAAFKPTLVNSESGWQVAKLVLELRTGERVLFLVLRPDGTLHATRWTVRTAPQLMAIALNLLALLAKGQAYFLAAADADQCACCGRHLTDPESRDAGIGPECIQHFYKRHDDEPEVTIDPRQLADEIKAVRRQMMEAHPDRGGSGDGELFARLTAELDSLRQMMKD